MIKSSYPKSVEYRGNKAAIYLQNQRGYQRFEVRFYDVAGKQTRGKRYQNNNAVTKQIPSHLVHDDPIEHIAQRHYYRIPENWIH